MFRRKNKQLTMEEEFRKRLKGDLRKNAFAFAAHMDRTSSWKHCGEKVCVTHTDPGNLYIYFGDDNGTAVVRADRSNGDSEAYPMDEHLKEFVWANVNPCHHFRTDGKDCGCGQQPGHSFTILGKKFDHLCFCPICFVNPDAETFERIKELVEAWKRCIEDKHGNKHVSAIDTV